MSTNPFASAEPWEVSTERILPEGNHVVRIEEASGGTSSGQHPQIELRFVNEAGSIRDWLVITQATVGKVVSLAQATGVGVPGDDDVDGLRVRDEWIYRLVGKTVGIVVREEPDNRDPSKTRTRVQGYVDPSRIKDSQQPSNGSSTYGQAPAESKRDIPF